jgi:hypothetical protein
VVCPQTGVGLKLQHCREVIATRPPLGWFEVHPENFMGEGGLPHALLGAVRASYPLSIHGVGLSLGSAAGIDQRHLDRLAKLVERYRPMLVSEHLAWSRFGDICLNDLLPLPYTEESLAIVCANVERMQDRLRRTVLIENPSTYLAYGHSTVPEPEFLGEVARRTGCGVLLDVNNVYVSACNLGFDAYEYIDAMPPACVGEIHLAGHAVRQVDGATLRIDDHGSPVCPAVWALYDYMIARFDRPVPVLIEWDTDVPPFATLLDEAARITDARLREAPLTALAVEGAL